MPDSQMVTHKEALDRAIDHLRPEAWQWTNKNDMEAAIRAYLDARGLVMVPKMLTHEMEVAARRNHEGEAYLPYSLYADFIAAAPDPFKEASE